jgi:hypothetical protein
MIEKIELMDLQTDDPRLLQFGLITKIHQRTCIEMQKLGFKLVFIPKIKKSKTTLTSQAIQLHYDNIRIGAIQYEGHNHIHLRENRPETVSLRFERAQLKKLNKPWIDRLEKGVAPYRQDRLDDKECCKPKAQSIAYRIPPNPSMFEKVIEEITLALSE